MKNSWMIFTVVALILIPILGIIFFKLISQIYESIQRKKIFSIRSRHHHEHKKLKFNPVFLRLIFFTFLVVAAIVLIIYFTLTPSAF